MTRTPAGRGRGKLLGHTLHACGMSIRDNGVRTTCAQAGCNGSADAFSRRAGDKCHAPSELGFTHRTPLTTLVAEARNDLTTYNVQILRQAIKRLVRTGSSSLR